jgi:hypothetical protein
MITSIKFLCACLLSLSLSLQGQPLDQALKDKPKLVTLSYNVDTNIARIEGPDSRAHETHKDWLIKNRIHYIKSALTDMISSYDPDIITLHECRKFVLKGTAVDSVTPMQDFLTEQGYIVMKRLYNPSALAFIHVMAFKPKFDFISEMPYYLTKTPLLPTDHPCQDTMTEEEKMIDDQRIKDHNYGEYWEKCVPVLKLRSQEDGRIIYPISAHFGLQPLHRLKASAMLSDLAQDILAKEPEACIIFQGGFNTFPDWKGPEQIETIKKQGVLKAASLPLLAVDGSPLFTSFIPFPYDFCAKERVLADRINDTMSLNIVDRRKALDELYKQEADAVGAQLDHVFYAGFGLGQSYLLPAPTKPDMAPRIDDEEAIKAYVLFLAAKNIPAFASDNQPLLNIFK